MKFVLILSLAVVFASAEQARFDGYRVGDRVEARRRRPGVAVDLFLMAVHVSSQVSGVPRSGPQPGGQRGVGATASGIGRVRFLDGAGAGPQHRHHDSARPRHERPHGHAEGPRHFLFGENRRRPTVGAALLLPCRPSTELHPPSSLIETNRNAASVPRQPRSGRYSHNWTSYSRAAVIEEFMFEMARDHPELVTVSSFGKTHLGNDMYMMKISSGGSGKKAMFVDGGGCRKK